MGHTIYLADDEKSIRELLHSFLASDGYAVRSFESGDALLEAFRQEPAELVILDIMMPEVDGLAVCKQLVVAPYGLKNIRAGQCSVGVLKEIFNDLELHLGQLNVGAVLRQGAIA